ncbi:hypothetical protein A2Z53_01945 [Candidatus Giovannonibacteria bacterium RIFCSPHIGHO2_02_42_15]|uniref:Uncharacterized protein n=1 Tax=Candidatus Giovannonibacteria bacterium RIFCSPHIGHO2_02_42_15 TaxID=1798329 RepID=A0A1F5VQM6_9BACT|nr:MAG: hypothetical protein A2Z53_01945 [Candidatus Giovannonibacteria bacterium RIFCSPHIGHO2_02_42_15]HBB49355.1 hypothetical protein [Candidatus Nomurabacteria bacterium]
MEIQQLIVGFILTVFGGLNAIRPEILVNFNIWTQKIIMGAQYIPSRHTFMAARIFGAILIVLGLFNLVGGIR